MLQFEIWGLDNTRSDWDCGEPRFRESFGDLVAARAALSDWQSGGRAAWVVDVVTGKRVPNDGSN
ncbi:MULTISPECIES: hypothetical protein [unclassified Xanthobacter]|uniref:hypothetical protein n=1 Tax=unclassified Xanthobacter TaxID=2623496 RepID=UPI001F25733F|nr:MULTISPECIES: hypothetical protein [unclassified Xanthobacter]